MATYEDVVTAYYGDPEQGVLPAVEFTDQVFEPDYARELTKELQKARDIALDATDVTEARGQCVVLLEEAGLGLDGLERFVKSQLSPRMLLQTRRATACRYEAVRLNSGRTAFKLLIQPNWQPPTHIRRALPGDRKPEIVANQLRELTEEYDFRYMSQHKALTAQDVLEQLHDTGFERDKLLDMAMAEFNPDAFIQLHQGGHAEQANSLASAMLSSRQLARVLHYLSTHR